MAEQLQIFVRSPGGARFFTWAPPTADTPVAALVESILTEYPRSRHGPIDLIDESSGKLVDLELPARAVANRVLAVRTRYVSNALDQLEALRGQEGPAFDYHHERGSSTIALEFRYPGLDRVGLLDGSGVVVKGFHRAMLILPGDFPEKPPRVLWLSPIFHPNLAADEEVWPPGYDWANAPTLLGLVGALIETLVGISIQIDGRFRIRRRRELNPEAAGWYRRNRRRVMVLAACARHSVHAPMEGYPLDSANVDWELRGALSGSDATVFLSRQAARGMPEFGVRCPAWLIGQKGQHGQAAWLYVERVAPRIGRESSAIPANAIGVLRGPGESEASLSHEPPLPLDARVQDGSVVLRLDSDHNDLTGFMVEADDLPPAEQTPQSARTSDRPITIRGPSPEQAAEPAEPEASSEAAESGHRLLKRELEPPVCTYCGIVCVPSEEWGACADCGFVMHAGCLHQLGGCPNTDCPRSALEPRPAESP